MLSPNAVATLETARLRLTPLGQSDMSHLIALMGDPDVMTWWDVAQLGPDIAEEVAQGQLASMAEGVEIHWAMRRLDNDAFVGVCDLSEIDRWHHRADVGFMLAKEAWGQGYALEAMQAVITHAAHAGLRRLSARTHLGNLRSDSLLEKLGFQAEGVLRGHVLRDGERRDCRLFGLLL